MPKREFWYPGIQYAERPIHGQVEDYYRQLMDYSKMGPMVGVPMENPWWQRHEAWKDPLRLERHLKVELAELRKILPKAWAEAKAAEEAESPTFRHLLVNRKATEARFIEEQIAVIERTLEIIREGKKLASTIKYRMNPVEPTVEGFGLILHGELTRYDQRLSKRERMPNIYRLGHLLGALGEVQDRMVKTRGPESLQSSDPKMLRDFIESLHLAFDPDLPPVRKTVKKINEFLATGKAPKYNPAIGVPNPAVLGPIVKTKEGDILRTVYDKTRIPGGRMLAGFSLVSDDYGTPFAGPFALRDMVREYLPSVEYGLWLPSAKGTTENRLDAKEIQKIVQGALFECQEITGPPFESSRDPRALLARWVPTGVEGKKAFALQVHIHGLGWHHLPFFSKKPRPLRAPSDLGRIRAILATRTPGGVQFDKIEMVSGQNPMDGGVPNPKKKKASGPRLKKEVWRTRHPLLKKWGWKWRPSALEGPAELVHPMSRSSYASVEFKKKGSFPSYGAVVKTAERWRLASRGCADAPVGHVVYLPITSPSNPFCPGAHKELAVPYLSFAGAVNTAEEHLLKDIQATSGTYIYDWSYADHQKWAEGMAQYLERNPSAYMPAGANPGMNPIDDPWVYALERNPSAYSKKARDFISKQIHKYVRPPYNMPAHQAVAVAIKGARKKGYKVPARPKRNPNCFVAMEFYGYGDPMFGGAGDDRYLGKSGKFLTGVSRESDIACFGTEEAARAAAEAAANRRTGGKIGVFPSPGRNPLLTVSPYPIFPTPEMAAPRAPLPVRPQIPNYHGLPPAPLPPRNEPNPKAAPPAPMALQKGVRVRLTTDHRNRHSGDIGHITGAGSSRGGKPKKTWNVRWEQDYRMSRAVPAYKLKVERETVPPLGSGPFSGSPWATSAPSPSGHAVRARHIGRTLTEAQLASYPGISAIAQAMGVSGRGTPKEIARAIKRHLKKNPEEAGALMVINPDGAAASFQKLTGKKPSPEELKQYRKAFDQYVSFHGKEPGALVPVKVQPGSSKFLVGVGQATEMNYRINFPSERAHTEWTHKAGDHGRKKKTKPAFFAADPQGQTVLLAQPKGSQVYFDPRKGLMG